MRIMFTLFLMLIAVCPAHSKDMRAVSIKIRAEHERALDEAKKSEKLIFQDRLSLEKEIIRVKNEIKALNTGIAARRLSMENLKEKEIKLNSRHSDKKMDLHEMSGVVRSVTRDLQTILQQSHFTARFPERLDRLKPLLNKERFPGMDDLKSLSGLFFQEMEFGGEVSLLKGTFMDRSGTSRTGDILTVGNFTAIYRLDKETGFLRYLKGDRSFAALPALPSWSISRNLNKYMNGEVEDITLDIFNGAALKQITHKLTMADKIKNGGPIVWPILVIGFFAFIIVIERTIYLKKVHANTDLVMGEVNSLALKGKWKECDKFVKDAKGRPVYNVLRAGLGARAETRETLDSILQEAILKEFPRLERFLPALNIMGAVAPLLGLLGTVTGMINTFHVITLYGTGDPRMMSGGISEAMVTTMLGLSVAIPIMLAHTFLSRRVDHIVGDMEEKAVALTNIIHREITMVE